jgi:NADH-quinone oxidoreductase subunit K
MQLIPITPYHYLVLAAALFALGATGLMLRRNIIILFMSIELMLNAVNLNLVAFSRLYGHVVGQVFALFIIAVAAAEAAIGLGILLAFYRNKETLNIDEVNLLRG